MHILAAIETCVPQHLNHCGVHLQASKKMKQRLWWREHKVYLTIGLLVTGVLVLLGE